MSGGSIEAILAVGFGVEFAILAIRAEHTGEEMWVRALLQVHRAVFGQFPIRIVGDFPNVTIGISECARVAGPSRREPLDG